MPAVDTPGGPASLFRCGGGHAWTTGLLRDVAELDDRGFVLTGSDVSPHAWPLPRAPLPFETCVPGVFAVGDVRHGSVKRVAGAVGKGSVAVGSVHHHLEGTADSTADGSWLTDPGWETEAGDDDRIRRSVRSKPCPYRRRSSRRTWPTVETTAPATSGIGCARAMQAAHGTESS